MDNIINMYNLNPLIAQQGQFSQVEGCTKLPAAAKGPKQRKNSPYQKGFQ